VSGKKGRSWDRHVLCVERKSKINGKTLSRGSLVPNEKLLETSLTTRQNQYYDGRRSTSSRLKGEKVWENWGDGAERVRGGGVVS
jgi:hypothetical protein